MGEAWEQGYIYYTVYPMNNTVSSILNSHIYLSFLQAIYSAQPDWCELTFAIVSL